MRRAWGLERRKEDVVLIKVLLFLAFFVVIIMMILYYDCKNDVDIDDDEDMMYPDEGE